MSLSPNYQKYFYSLFSDETLIDRDNLSLYLDQVLTKQSNSHLRSVRLSYSAADVQQTRVFCDLADFSSDLTLGDEISLEEESVYLGDQISYSRWFYSETLNGSTPEVEQQYTNYDGTEIVNTTPTAAGVEFTDPITLTSPEVDLSQSDLDLSVTESDRTIYYSPSTWTYQLEDGLYQGTHQFNYLPVGRGVVGFTSSADEIYSTFILPGTDDGYLPGENIEDLSPTATLETIANGIYLALAEQDVDYIVSVLKAICAIARRDGLITQTLDSYILNTEAYPGLWSSYHRLSLLPASEEKDTYGNALLGAAIVEAIKFFKDRPYALQLDLTGSLTDFEGQILSLLKSIGYFIAGALDLSSYYLPGVIDSYKIPSEGYSYQATTIAPIFLAGLLSLQYDYDLHYTAARLYCAVRALPLNPSALPISTFYKDSDLALSLVNRTWFSYAFDTKEVAELLSLFAALPEQSQRTNLITYLRYLLLKETNTSADYYFAVGQLLSDETWFDSVAAQANPLTYYLNNVERRTKFKSLALEAHALALLKTRPIFSEVNYNLYAAEADAYTTYLRQWFAYALPTGYRWFNPDLALIDQTAIGSLAAGAAQVAFGYALKLSIFESGKQLTSAQGYSLSYWSELMLQPKPLLVSDGYWQQWLSSYLSLRQSLAEQLEDFLLLIGFYPTSWTAVTVNVLAGLDATTHYLPYASDTAGTTTISDYPFTQKADSKVEFVRFAPEGGAADFEPATFDPAKPELDVVRYLANTESYELVNSNKTLEQLTDLKQINYTPRKAAGFTQQLRAGHLYSLDDLTIDQSVNGLSYWVDPLRTGIIRINVLDSAGVGLSLLIRSAPVGTKFEVQSFTSIAV